MLHYESFLIVFLFIIVLNFLFNKFNLIRDKKNISFHKKFTGNEINPPFSGGIFIIATICIFFPENFIFKLFLLLIFFIGYCSDTNLLKSPNLRFYLQIIVVILLTEGIHLQITIVIPVQVPPIEQVRIKNKDEIKMVTAHKKIVLPVLLNPQRRRRIILL